MNEYCIQLSGGSISIRWEYRFRQPSDEMAVEYAAKLCRVDPAAKTAMRIDLFNVSADIHVKGWKIHHEETLRELP